MGHEAIKLELIEWLTKLDDHENIDRLCKIQKAKILNGHVFGRIYTFGDT